MVVERGAELSLQVSVAGHDFDPNTMETRPVSPDQMVDVVVALVRPYIKLHPGPAGRGLVDKLKGRLEDLWNGG